MIGNVQFAGRHRPNFAVMASARILLGIGVGGFWAMGSGSAFDWSRHTRSPVLRPSSRQAFAATVTSFPLDP